MNYLRFKFIRLLAVLVLTLQPASATTSGALPALVSRATDSLSALLSPRSQTNQQPLVAAPASLPLNNQQQQQQQPQNALLSQLQQQPASKSQAPASMLQAHLNSLQTQAQRQLNQLNGLVASTANLTASNQYGNVLDVISNVGKAIQQQITSAGQVQIVQSSPNAGGTELANNKKNEYQSIVVNDNQQLNLSGPQAPSGTPTFLANNSTASSNAYREQGEQLRQEIVRRAGQLQQVVASSMEILKNSSDLIVRRLLEQLNNRLDQAKSKADKIINEPATNEVAIRALHTINQGLNNLNSIITNLVNRLELTGKSGDPNGIQQMSSQQQPLLASTIGQRAGSNAASTFLDPSRLKQNLQQLSQQFSSAISAAQQQRRMQQQQQQQQNIPVAQVS